MRRLLLSRWARSLAIIGAYLLALQTMGMARFALGADDDCCCHARSASCHCRICSHARALESGKPLLQTCGGTSAPGVAVVVLDPSLPAAAPQPAPRLAADAPRVHPPRLVSAPPGEVPTPPPLV